MAANIAEGYGRGARGDYLRFLDIARGSLAEVEYYVHFLTKEGLVAAEVAEALDACRTETGRVLNGLMQATRRATKDGWNRDGPNPRTPA